MRPQLTITVYVRVTDAEREWLELHTAPMSATVRKAIDLAMIDYPAGLPEKKEVPE